MPEQLIFDLPGETAFGRDDFFVSPANALTVEVVENWADWPLGKLILLGPAGSGKSHLAHIWSGMAEARVISGRDLLSADVENLATGAICVDDLNFAAGHGAAEQALFHLHNLMQQNGSPLMMTGSGRVSGWNIKLPDLASRLQGSNTVALQPPDDPLLSALLVKLFADRQLRIEPGLITYLLPRMSRSFATARQLVAALDKEALKKKRRIGVKMARKVLEALAKETD
ncbi:MAG: hypothetical protein GY947_03085 [Rhodobacteraceae bacterium]|nr:hypothetical protein [Paracoccaceae bacterium]